METVHNIENGLTKPIDIIEDDVFHTTTRQNRMESESTIDPDEEEELDPRVETELQKMNAAMDGINYLETELMEGKALYNQMLKQAGLKLNDCAEKLGKCVEKARPYFEALKKAKQAQYRLHKAAVHFEDAQGNLSLAKSHARAAETRAASNCDHLLTQKIQQLLNKATTEVMEAASVKNEAWKNHQTASEGFTVKQKEVLDLSKSLKKQIKKARPYYDMKMALNKQLEPQKERVQKMSEGIQFSKAQYNITLRNLEHISEQIHRMRKLRERRLRQFQSRVNRPSLTVSEDEFAMTGYRITGSDIEMANSMSSFEVEGIYNEPSVYSMSPTSSSLASFSETESEISREDDSREFIPESPSSIDFDIINSRDVRFSQPVEDFLNDFTDSSPTYPGKPISVYIPTIRKCRSLVTVWPSDNSDNNNITNENTYESFSSAFSSARNSPLMQRQRSLTDSVLSMLSISLPKQTRQEIIADLTMTNCQEENVEIQINIIDCEGRDKTDLGTS